MASAETTATTNAVWSGQSGHTEDGRTHAANSSGRRRERTTGRRSQDRVSPPPAAQRLKCRDRSRPPMPMVITDRPSSASSCACRTASSADAPCLIAAECSMFAGRGRRRRSGRESRPCAGRSPCRRSCATGRRARPHVGILLTATADQDRDVAVGAGFSFASRASMRGSAAPRSFSRDPAVPNS